MCQMLRIHSVFNHQRRRNVKWSEERRLQEDAVAKKEKAGIFAMLAKISLGLRKFRNHSENFAILAKFSLCENFARLAKFR